jgi:hypothetical protein
MNGLISCRRGDGILPKPGCCGVWPGILKYFSNPVALVLEALAQSLQNPAIKLDQIILCEKNHWCTETACLHDNDKGPCWNRFK